MTELCKLWMELKDAEKQAADKRREVEDQLLSLIGGGDFEGTQNHEFPGYKIKLVGRYNRKIDSEKAQEIAQEHGLENFLTLLFRWKPELNLTAWKATTQEITAKFADCITTTPGRPSFTIEKQGE